MPGGGIAGLQWSLPVIWSQARKRGIDLTRIVNWMSSRVAEFSGLDRTKGKISKGFDADLTVWDPEEKFTVKESDVKSRHTITPYMGLELYGKVKKTFVKGHLVFDEGLIQGPKGEVLLRN